MIGLMLRAIGEIILTASKKQRKWVTVMPDPKLNDLDPQKRRLQDDHDQNDIGQKKRNRTGGFQYKHGEKSDPKNPKPEE
jgi:hypothetical protein